MCFIDELFERLFSIQQTKGHLHEFKESKRTGYDCFRDVWWFDGNLVACSGEIKLTENGLAMKNAGEVLYVRNWVVITDGVVVKSVV